MTRDQFIEDVCSWNELIEFSNEYGCGTCDDVIVDDQLDSYVCDDIRDATTTDTWDQIRDSLDNIPEGYAAYRVDGSFDYQGLDDTDFDEYKTATLEWGDDEDFWDEEEDEDEELPEAEEDSEPEEDPAPAEDFTVAELITLCSAQVTSIVQTIEGERLNGIYRF